MRTLLIGLRTVFFMTCFLSLWFWLSMSMRQYDPQLLFGIGGWSVWPGILLMIAGGVLVLTCAGLFTALGRGTPAPFDAPRKFVAAGPYRYVRNPMYVGGMTVLIGLSLFQQSASMLLFSIGWLVLAHMFVVLYEEPVLRDKFGAAYENYLQTVPRWIPHATARRSGS